MYHHSSQDHYFQHLSKEEKALYLGFREYLKSEICRIACEVDRVLSVGLDKIDEAEKKAYYESEEYKKALEEKNAAEAAKSAEDAKYDEYNKSILAKYAKEQAGRQGKYRGLNKMLGRLDYWSSASSDHIGHIKGGDPNYDDGPQLKHSHIKVPNIEYVPKKSVKVKKARIAKYRSKYNNLCTVIGLLFLFLEKGYFDTYFDTFVVFNYKDYKSFSLSESLAELRAEFPKSIANGIINIDYKPTVKDMTHMVASISPGNRITEINVNTMKYPFHNDLIGLKMGDSFRLPNIDIVYTILYTY